MNAASIVNREYVLNHAMLGMQRKSDEPLIKRNVDFDGIECYVYVKVEDEDCQGSWKILSEHIKALGLTEEAVIKAAEQNTVNDTRLISMGEALGFPVDGELHVLSNNSGFKGAGAILNKALIKQFAEGYGVNEVIAIPSSIHEWILIPKTEETDMDKINTIICTVNASVVSDAEQLGDKAFVLTA